MSMSEAFQLRITTFTFDTQIYFVAGSSIVIFYQAILTEYLSDICNGRDLAQKWKHLWDPLH